MAREVAMARRSSDRLRLPSGRASDARAGGAVGPAAASHAIMAAHPAEHAQQDATLRTMAQGMLILNAFPVRAAPGRFIRCRCSAIQNNVQTNTYDPDGPERHRDQQPRRPLKAPTTLDQERDCGPASPKTALALKHWPRLGRVVFQVH